MIPAASERVTAPPASPGKLYGPICGAQWGSELRRADPPWMTGATIAIAWALTTYANKSGANAHPGEQKLAHDARVSPRTVRRQLALLRRHGWIWRSGTGSGAGRGNTGQRGLSDTYMLTCPEAIGPRLLKPREEAKTPDTRDPSFTKRPDTGCIKDRTPGTPHQSLKNPSTPSLRRRADAAAAARPAASTPRWDYQGRAAEDFAVEHGLLDVLDQGDLNALENMMRQGYNPTRIVAYLSGGSTLSTAVYAG